MWQVLDMTWMEIGGEMTREKTVEQCQQNNKKRPTKHNMTKQNISSKLLSDFLKRFAFCTTLKTTDYASRDTYL